MRENQNEKVSSSHEWMLLLLELLVRWYNDEAYATFNTGGAEVVHWSVEGKTSSDESRSPDEMGCWGK